MKKTYITPATSTHSIKLRTGLLVTLSANDGTRNLLGNGGKTNGNVTESDARSDNAWDIWGEDNE